jgi:hypothetical protein
MIGPSVRSRIVESWRLELPDGFTLFTAPDPKHGVVGKRFRFTLVVVGKRFPFSLVYEKQMAAQFCQEVTLLAEPRPRSAIVMEPGEEPRRTLGHRQSRMRLVPAT